jgi:hypothetical protein
LPSAGTIHRDATIFFTIEKYKFQVGESSVNYGATTPDASTKEKVDMSCLPLLNEEGIRVHSPFSLSKRFVAVPPLY